MGLVTTYLTCREHFKLETVCSIKEKILSNGVDMNLHMAKNTNITNLIFTTGGL